jgi:hypothetical protein
MNKFLSLSMVAALAMGFAACSSDEPIVTNSSDEIDDGTGPYVQFIVSMTENSSRADYSLNETSGEYRTGSDAENQVKKVYAYFTEDGTNLVQMANEEYYAEYGAVKVQNTSLANDAKYNGEAVKEAADKGEAYITAKERIDANLKMDHTYTVYLLCNKPAPTTVTTVKELLDSKLEFDVSQSDGIAELGIPMAARSIEGTITDTLHPTKANTITNPCLLQYEVERSFARIAITSGVTDIPLYEMAGDPTIENGTYKDSGVQNLIGSLDILKYYIVNQSNEYYTYRHVGNIDPETFKTTMPEEDVATLFGPVDADGGANPYVIDPNSDQKTNGTTFLSGYTQSFNFAYRHYSKFKAAVGGTSDEPAVLGYMPENVMANKAQKKGQATGVIFQVRLKPTTVLGKTKGEKSATYKEGDNLWYYDGVFYDGIEAIQANVSSEITEDTYLNFDIQCYKKGLAYYEYFIRHNNNYQYTTMANMEFAIVRNNSYELAISAAAMAPYTTLVPNIPEDEKDKEHPNTDPENDPDGDPDPGTGTDPDDPEWPDTPVVTPDPDPNSPEPGEDVENATLYLRVKVVVRPWIMRTNPTVLGQ